MEFEIRKNVMPDLPPGRALTLWPGRFSASPSRAGGTKAATGPSPTCLYAPVPETALGSVNRLEVLWTASAAIQLGTVADPARLPEAGLWQSVSWRRCSGTGQTGVTACFFCQ